MNRLKTALLFQAKLYFGKGFSAMRLVLGVKNVKNLFTNKFTKNTSNC